MARFDVHRLAEDILVLDIQADLLSDFKTRVVAPLLPAKATPRSLERLHPIFEIDGQDFVLATHLIAAVPLRELGSSVASMADRHESIMAAIDMLVAGY